MSDELLPAKNKFCFLLNETNFLSYKNNIKHTYNIKETQVYLRDTEMYLNMAHQKRYDDLLLHSWWLLKEPFVVLFKGQVLELFNLRIRTGCVPAS